MLYSLSRGKRRNDLYRIIVNTHVNVFCFVAVPSTILGFPGGASHKEHTCQCKRHKRHGFSPWVEKIPWSRKWQPTPVFLPGESYGQRSLLGCSPWGHKASDMTDATEHSQPSHLSSQARGWTHVSSSGDVETSNHWSTRGFPFCCLFKGNYFRSLHLIDPKPR